MLVNTKTKQYALLASTDINQCPQQIVAYYQLRFQIEFIFRDAKQFTGLNHCQARDDDKLDFHFNLSLAAVNVSRLLLDENPDIKSMNSLVRMEYNTRLITFLFKQLSPEAEFDLFNPIVHKAIRLGIMNNSQNSFFAQTIVLKNSQIVS